MSRDALIRNSQFIRLLVGNEINDIAVHDLVCRYILFIDRIYQITSRSFIKSVFLENKLDKGFNLFFVRLCIIKARHGIGKIFKKILFLLDRNNNLR